MYHQDNAVKLVVAFLAAMTSSASAQLVFGGGACPITGTQAGFDLNQYLGTWYEYERFDNWFEIGMVCVRAEYGDNGDGSISVLNAGLRDVRVFGRSLLRIPASIDGSATIPDPAKPAELKVSFSQFDRSENANYYVVDTDYTSYAVVFSCSALPGNFFNVQSAWILTRVRGQAPANLAVLKSNLAAAGVNPDKFKLQDQTNCS